MHINHSVEGSHELYALTVVSELDLRLDDLIGKNVLDLGCGPASLGKYLNQFGVNCLSLDEEFINSGILNNQRKHRVQASAESTPFGSESMDYIVSKLGIPMLSGVKSCVLETEIPTSSEYFYSELDAHILEIKRLLRGGGEFRIFPVDLQYVANHTMADIHTKLTPTELMMEFERIERISYETYKSHGFSNAILKTNKHGDHYLSWTKQKSRYQVLT